MLGVPARLVGEPRRRLFLLLHRQRAVARKWSRRFSAQAASSWPVANGRSLPYEIVAMRDSSTPSVRQVGTHGRGAVFTEGQVVGFGPALVAVAFDADLH